jgi:hypothetical protein
MIRIMTAVPSVISVSVLGHWRLRVGFSDGLTGDVDLSDVRGAGPFWEPLKDPDVFARAYVDKDAGTVAWPGNIDVDPESLHEEASRNPVRAKRGKRKRGVIIGGAAGGATAVAIIRALGRRSSVRP